MCMYVNVSHQEGTENYSKKDKNIHAAIHQGGEGEENVEKQAEKVKKELTT